MCTFMVQAVYLYRHLSAKHGKQGDSRINMAGKISGMNSA
jgi:hypothetical protein